MSKYTDEEKAEEIMSEIGGLKQLLASSDYKALKYADGALTEEEYAEDKAQRAAYRASINALEAELEALKEG